MADYFPSAGRTLPPTAQQTVTITLSALHVVSQPHFVNSVVNAPITTMAGPGNMRPNPAQRVA
jgi:hypothetical protein